MPAYPLTSLGIVCALGAGKAQVLKNALGASTSGMIASDDIVRGKSVFVGRVETPLPEICEKIYDTRTNRLLLKALEEIRADVDKLILKFGKRRVGIVLGSSNTGIEEFCRDYAKADGDEGAKALASEYTELGNPSAFLKKHLGLDSPCYTVSTACSSSAKAFSAARRLIESDICDAVIVGGADSLCRFVVNGFNALNSVSFSKANPFSANRDGINLGEAAALFIMQKPELAKSGDICLLGSGETSDAYHATSPDPSGAGAASAMKQALSDANLKACDIDYINLHGTATRYNDAMEALAIHEVFGADTPCSSTKPMTGHTLGAAGALECALCYLTMSDLNEKNLLLPHIFDGAYDSNLPPIRLAKQGEIRRARRTLSNSFAFGGSNASVILGRI